MPFQSFLPILSQSLVMEIKNSKNNCMLVIRSHAQTMHFVTKFSHGDQKFKKQLHARDTLTCADYASIRIINVI